MERKLFLVVDEDETTIRLLESIFQHPYQILSFARGLRAIQLAKTEQVHLVIHELRRARLVAESGCDRGCRRAR